jgi:hypothetical protein
VAPTCWIYASTCSRTPPPRSRATATAPVVSAFGTPQQVALRSQIVLAADQGQSDNAIAQQLDTNRKTVNLWRARFARDGLDSLWEVASGRGRKPTYGPEKIQSIVDATLRSKPKGMTQWSWPLVRESASPPSTISGKVTINIVGATHMAAL